MSDALKEPITDYWLAHYVNRGHCSLCGNHGVIDTTDSPNGWTPAGLHVGRRNFCICPNGQSLRAAQRAESP